VQNVIVRVRGFHLPKAGSRPDEYEDAWGVSEDGTCLAVADGASDAFESGEWARLLVRAFLADQPPSGAALAGWLRQPTDAWKSFIHWDQLTYYQEAKARDGALATFLGVRYLPPPAGASWPWRWRAFAVGDACLFHVREDRLIAAFPLERSDAFSTTPALLSTNPQHQARSVTAVRALEGELLPGDTMFFATDAFAAWFLNRLERGIRPWHFLTDVVRGLETFDRLIDRVRFYEGIRNDDTTLVLAWLASPGAARPHQTQAP
jgi:hypothetical protein